MLDSFEIVTTSGVVLWSRSYANIGANLINSLIREVFIESQGVEDEQTSTKPSFKKDQYTLKWTTFKELGLIFVAVYQSLLHLSWIDKLLDNIKTIFVRLYGDQVKKSNTGRVNCPFDEYFDQQLRELEGLDGTGNVNAQRVTVTESPLPRKSDNTKEDVFEEATPVRSDTVKTPPNASRPSLTPANRPSQKLSRRARKAANQSAHASSGEESGSNKNRTLTKGGQPKKMMRRWDADGLMDEDGDMQLDYSQSSIETPNTNTTPNGDVEGLPRSEPGSNHQQWGKKTSTGEFILRDIDDEVHSILSSANTDNNSKPNNQGVVGTSIGNISNLFRNVIGGKVLTQQDLEKPIKGMEEHLMKKNVAREAAMSICEGVSKSLIGVKTGNFQMGVNGVGKSTNLSKLAFFLLQNQHRVLIAACDTFRSGAVEQLRVHARNLRELCQREGQGKSEIELFEKGYGKDAAIIAREAVSYASTHNFNVVLIDTAGRRHNDTRLMSSLEKFAKLSQPHKILMVGEALVGTDSVMQARHFNEAFGTHRGLDGFLISKCDTVGDMIGTVVSMVYATGIPVLFLGTGQHYGDLRVLNVRWAVGLLMK
ncbi:MAG: hypothetical protein M1823_000299 [Watsoniomyces obsoletus]|nr:MAG: hypothetical protein M1823_000299 [Watsoniomyces obsoletus]